MKQFNEYLLPDVGKYFKSNNKISFKVDPDSEYEELEINSDNIEIVGDYAFVDKVFAIKVSNKREMKTSLVKKLFSNDDQIAIILNKNKTITTFMNGWRTWFSEVIDKILAMK